MPDKSGFDFDYEQVAKVSFDTHLKGAILHRNRRTAPSYDRQTYLLESTDDVGKRMTQAVSSGYPTALDTLLCSTN